MHVHFRNDCRREVTYARVFQKWLKKGGKLLFTTSCYSEGEPTVRHKDAGQHLVSPVAYSKVTMQ